MKKLFLSLLLVGTLFLTITPITDAQIECDQCGYCVGRERPGNWDACKACLYGDQDTLSTRETLPGKFYTQLGCIDTGVVNTSGTNSINSGLNSSVIGSLANFLLNRLLFPLAGVLSFLYIIYGAYLLITSQDDPERKLQGHGTITGAIVGVIFTILSVFLVNFIASDVLKIPGFSSGSIITINAGGVPSIDASGQTVFPSVEVKFNNQRVGFIQSVGSNTVNDNNNPAAITYSEYKIPTNRPYRTGDSVVIRFTNDHCPACNGSPAPQRGDRNFFLMNAKVDKLICRSFTYRGRIYTAGSKTVINETYPITCNL